MDGVNKIPQNEANDTVYIRTFHRMKLVLYDTYNVVLIVFLLYLGIQFSSVVLQTNRSHAASVVGSGSVYRR